MKKCALLLALLLAICLPAAAGQWQWKQEPTPVLSGRLAGVKIGVDPGHQRHQNTEKEPVAPDSKETKAKVSSGTAGVRTKVPEYQVNLDVSLQLRDALEALGCEVYMTRQTNDVDISNRERALMMNELGVDLVLRIHCNGAENSGAHGIGLYVTKTGDIAEASLQAAEAHRGHRRAGGRHLQARYLHRPELVHSAVRHGGDGLYEQPRRGRKAQRPGLSAEAGDGHGGGNLRLAGALTNVIFSEDTANGPAAD